MGSISYWTPHSPTDPTRTSSSVMYYNDPKKMLEKKTKDYQTESIPGHRLWHEPGSQVQNLTPYTITMFPESIDIAYRTHSNRMAQT